MTETDWALLIMIPTWVLLTVIAIEAMHDE